MRYLVVLSALFLAGCVTLSGHYRVIGVKPDGTEIPRTVLAQGSGIYQARNAVCLAYPGATVRIVDADTGEELRSESPYACR